MCSNVFAPALRDVGRLWELKELSIADEHMATEITAAVVLRALTPRQPTGGLDAVVSCGPGGGHSLGGRVLSSLLMARGWRVTFLGADTPADAFEPFVALRRPALVAFSIKLAGEVPHVIELIGRLRSLPESPAVLVGGAAVSGLRIDIGADHVQDDLAAALAWIAATFDHQAA